MMDKLNSIISSYQQKICTHDRQLWEQSYEKELFQRLHSVPRRLAKINTSLIDVDLFRGSAFSMSKSQTGWLSVATVALFRLVFFPLYYRWWLCSTCSSVFALLCVLYIFQVSSLVFCYSDSRQSQFSETLTVADYVTPYIMMYVLTVVHSHITANYNVPLRHSTFTVNKREKLPHTSRVKQSRSMNAAKFERSDGNTVCNSSEKSQNEHCLRSLPCKRNQLLISGASSYSLPCSESSEKRSSSKSEILKRTENWLGSKSFSGTPEWLGQSISETTSCQNFQSERGPALEFLQLSRELSDFTQMSERIGCENENILSSRESVTAKSSLCSSVTAGSVLTIVGSSVDETTIVEENVDREFASKQPLGAEPVSIPAKSSLSEESVGQRPAAENVAKSCRTFETQTDYSHSCYLLSALESKFEERSSEAHSIADSNTSMSDTCNSSFVSSGDEDEGAKEADNSGDQPPFVDNSKQYLAEFARNASCGVRQRRRANSHTAVLSSDKSNPGKTFELGSESFDDNLDTSFHLSASGYADKQIRLGSESMEAADAASSDEDESHVKSCAKLRGQLMRQSAIRKSGVGRRRKNGNSADVVMDQKVLADKVSDSQGFSRRRIQLCDSDNSAKKTLSLPLAKKVRLSEFEDDVTETKLLASRNSGLNSSADRKIQTSKKAAANATESSTTGLGSSSIINCISSNVDKVSCVIWSSGGAVHKVDLTIMDIGWTIVRAVDCQQERCDYMILGVLLSFISMCTPSVYRLYHNLERENQTTNCTYANSTKMLTSYASQILGQDFGQTTVLVNGLVQRLCLSLLFFFLLSVAERTFKQRLLYAKYFCYLTSSRKAKKYDLPHFRLNKVRNIKTWLSLRSFLKKRGPQRSVESVVSTAFILAVILVSILCIELLQDYGHFLEHLGNWELVLWSMVLGVYLLRFITLGTKINKKYRNLSVLITEQINLYLHMEQKPHKKGELMVANSVLKLAENLLKELESPFKISGLSANPFLYNITKVVILSAFSAVLTELLGFKLKLYKIKIRS